tara:strand:+ start:52 stop:516 length:465 start_codon:yes stop_codon:yes gene_type:complete
MSAVPTPTMPAPDRSFFESLRRLPSERTSRQADFASVLGIENRLARRADLTQADEARGVAEGFVAKVFIEPLLKMVREANTQPPPFGPGPGEKEFGSLIDAQRAMDLVRSAEWPIVDRLASDLTRSPAPSLGGQPAPRSHPCGELPGSRFDTRV